MANSNFPKRPFLLTFPENQKKDSNISSTPQYTFDALDDFIDEKNRVLRYAQVQGVSHPKVDYSNFANHVFFDSAASKFSIAQNRILQQYPYNGSSTSTDHYALSSSDYESYVLSQWPSYCGYVQFSNSNGQYISASDVNNSLYVGSSSLQVSSWINPFMPQQTGFNAWVCGILSSSGGGINNGWCLQVRNTGSAIPFAPLVEFVLYSGTLSSSVSSSISPYTGSFFNVAGIYDTNAQMMTLYINGQPQISSSVVYGPIQFGPSSFVVGANLSSSGNYYSGSIDAVRVMFTSSALLLQKYYNRSIFSENYVALHYAFNESVTGINSIDSMIVDYSKNAISGTYVNYISGSSRVSGSAMFQDNGSPILYSIHPSVVSFTSSIVNSASLYDKNNGNYILNLIGSDILIEDQNAQGLMTPFVLAMARFFDWIKLYIDQFDNLKIMNYTNIGTTPDLFLSNLQKYFGWKLSEQYAGASPPSLFFGNGVLSSGSLNYSLVGLRNEFWKRVLNNLPYLLKTKGKRYNLDAYFNVLGINQENISIKEYGYLPGGSIDDTRINKNKLTTFLSIGTGSAGATGSYVFSPGPFSSSVFTIETLMQLPFPSGSYTQTNSSGSVWQFISGTTALTASSFSLLWNKGIGSTNGYFILTGSDGQVFSSSVMSGVFDGRFLYVAAGVRSGTIYGNIPFIEVRSLNNIALNFSASFSGATAFSGVFTGSNYSFVLGANSGSLFSKNTQGLYAQARIWSKALSPTELNSHALHYENIGTDNPISTTSSLVAYWALNENITASSVGQIYMNDLSQNGNTATGSIFTPSVNPYFRQYYGYNFLSPALDLHWTQNKIRIRNKNQLSISDAATDTNEVSLEFNLIDSLNQDISKIFSTFTTLNNIIGNPINKYRDEYQDLENYRSVYFQRLGDSLNFPKFFKLFTWFDKKLSDSIKQLLPSRAKFIGGEQIVESHLLERPKYNYKYSVFHTPQDPQGAVISGAFYTISGSLMTSISGGVTLNSISGAIMSYPMVSLNREGEDRYDRNKIPAIISGNFTSSFFRTRYSGDTLIDLNSVNADVNSRNEWPKRISNNNDRNNFYYDSGSFVNSQLGNGFVFSVLDTSKDVETYLMGYRKYVKLLVHYFSGTQNGVSGTVTSNPSSITGTITFVSGVNIIPGTVYISGTNYNLNTDPNINTVTYGYFFYSSSFVTTRLAEITFELSQSGISTTDIPLKLVDTYNPAINDYSNLIKTSHIIGTTVDGYTKYNKLLTLNFALQDLTQSIAASSNFGLSGSVLSTSSLRNIDISIIEPLSNAGAAFFTSLYNQNMKFYNINTNVLKAIE